MTLLSERLLLSLTSFPTLFEFCLLRERVVLLLTAFPTSFQFRMSGFVEEARQDLDRV